MAKKYWNPANDPPATSKHGPGLCLDVRVDHPRYRRGSPLLFSSMKTRGSEPRSSWPANHSCSARGYVSAILAREETIRGGGAHDTVGRDDLFAIPEIAMLVEINVGHGVVAGHMAFANDSLEDFRVFDDI